MLEVLRSKALLTTTGLVVKAAGMGFSPLDPEGFALAVGGLMIKRVRDYVRRDHALPTPSFATKPSGTGIATC